jgi:hypothetical protein
MTVDVLSQSAAGFSNEIPHVSWAQFEDMFQWNQGEHAGMVGPTGEGKTNLSLLILPRRDFITVFATKPEDETLDLYAKAFHYKKITEWNPKLNVRKYPHRLLWPSTRDMRTMIDRQRHVFEKALHDIYSAGSWCVYFDELWWICQILGLTQYVKILLQQGRSVGLSLLCATQRPAWVPLEVYDQSTHLFFWADNDERNLNRISSIGSFNSVAIRARIATLRPHEVLYINVRAKYMCTFLPPLLVMKGGKAA